MANWRNQLTTRRDAIAESFGELRAFKKANHLTRPAHSATRIATWGTLVLAWLIESTINSFLLRQNDDMGLVGGFGAAAAIASINVGVSYMAGRLIWPHTKHPRLLPRLSGQAGTVLWVVFLLAWNLVAAHYRDAKTAGIPSPENEALTLLITQPIGLDSIYSWGLLIAGVIGSLVAAIAAYQMDDPYPGYGSISRRHDARCENYTDDVEEATEELKEIRDEAIEQSGKVRSELGTQLRERDRVLAARQSFCRRYEENNVQLEQAGNALLETYRAVNRRSRTEAAPTHFEPGRRRQTAAPHPNPCNLPRPA